MTVPVLMLLQSGGGKAIVRFFFHLIRDIVETMTVNVVMVLRKCYIYRERTPYQKQVVKGQV